MKRSRLIGSGLLACLLILPFVLAAATQDDKTKEAPPRPVEFKGEAKLNVHTYKLEKGTTYRITVKAEGFTPNLSIRNMFGAVASMNGVGEGAQLIFTPFETQEYQLRVESSIQGKIEKGPNAYAITIERANFAAENKIKDPLKVSEQVLKMEVGKMYLLTVKSQDFEPDVRIVEGNKTVAHQFCLGPKKGLPGEKADFETSLVFVPTRTADYRVLVDVGPYSRPTKGLNYTTALVEQKPLLLVNGELTKDDPIYQPRGAHHKVHTVKLMAGKIYQIDHKSTAFDAYLYLEDPAGKILLQDDDGGGNLNARIVFRPTKNDSYRVIATSLGANRTGPYTLAVFENPGAQPRFPFPDFDPKQFKDKFPGFDPSKLPGFDPSKFKDKIQKGGDKIPGFDPSKFKDKGFDPSQFKDKIPPGFDPNKDRFLPFEEKKAVKAKGL